jgi:hypothetical protein
VRLVKIVLKKPLNIFIASVMYFNFYAIIIRSKENALTIRQFESFQFFLFYRSSLLLRHHKFTFPTGTTNFHFPITHTAFFLSLMCSSCSVIKHNVCVHRTSGKRQSKNYARRISRNGKISLFAHIKN